MNYRNLVMGWVAIASLTCMSSSRAELSLGQSIPAIKVEKAEGGVFDFAKDAKGKIVVFEWLNFECPFVRKHYNDSTNMQATQAWAKEQGVIWVSVASSGKKKNGKGKEGYFEPKELIARKTALGAKSDMILVDTSGVVGKTFGAKTTPHIFIFGKDSKLAYMGAIDSEPSADAEDIKTATNYVKEAVTALAAGKPYSKKTDPYGCSVKYGD